MADGVTEAGKRVYSERRYIDVERPDQPISVRTAPGGPIKSYPQEQFVLNVIGTYRDKSDVYLTDSTQTSYKSENSQIVSVPQNGFIKSLALGMTTVVIHVGATVIRVPITVKNR